MGRPVFGVLLALLLARPARGWDVHAAAASLGLPEQVLVRAAAVSGLEPLAVAAAVRHDSSARLAPSGALSYACGFPHHSHGDDEEQQHQQLQQHEDDGAPNAAAAGTTPAALDDSAIPLDDAFRLHSRPGATRKLQLAFRGCNTTGTAWNTAQYSQRGGMATIVTPPYDADGNEDAFSDRERRNVIQIWAAVAQDFSIFDVDVTTEDVRRDGIDRTHESDVFYGMRVCVGGTAAAWMAEFPPGSDARVQPLGVSFVGVFGRINPPRNADMLPYIFRDVFVFSGLTSSIKSVWEACSHEIAHTLGLLHHGNYSILPNGTQASSPYYPGSQVFGAIMGAPHFSQFSQWSDGTFPPGVSPTSKQSDIDVMSDPALPRLPRVADEAGGTPETALVLCAQSACSVSDPVTGLVTTSLSAVANSADDADCFTLNASAAGPASIRIAYAANYRRDIEGSKYYYLFRKGNLRLGVAFVAGPANVTLDEIGSPLDVYSTHQALTASLPAPGSYTFCAAPTMTLGQGALLPTNYGNVGSYVLSVQWPANLTAPTSPPSPEPSPSPSPGVSVDCSIANCNPNAICTNCVCSSPSTVCSCNADEGFEPGVVSSMPQCIWALAGWSDVPDSVGYFRAAANARVRLPWRLLVGSIRGCPAAGKAVVRRSRGIVLGSKLLACPRGSPVPLRTAAQASGFEACSGGSGYTVFAVDKPGNMQSVQKRCRTLTVTTTDGRKFTGMIWVTR